MESGHGWSQAVCKRLRARAGERGRARVGKPRWARLLTITAGSSMAAMSVKGLPQCGQAAMSISNTRLSNWAQLMRARVAGGDALGSVEGAGTWSGSPGTIWDLRAALGASMPWKRMRWSRGRGTSAAKRCRNSNGVITRWVVPSRYGVLSWRTTSPARVLFLVFSNRTNFSQCKKKVFQGNSIRVCKT